MLVAWPSYQHHRRASLPALLVGGLGLLVLAIFSEDWLGEYAETSLTVIGSVVLVLGHILNLRCARARQ